MSLSADAPRVTFPAGLGWASRGTGNALSMAKIRVSTLGPVQGPGSSPHPDCCGRPHGPPCPSPAALLCPTAKSSRGPGSLLRHRAPLLLAQSLCVCFPSAWSALSAEGHLTCAVTSFRPRFKCHLPAILSKTRHKQPEQLSPASLLPALALTPGRSTVPVSTDMPYTVTGSVSPCWLPYSEPGA